MNADCPPQSRLRDFAKDSAVGVSYLQRQNNHRAMKTHVAFVLSAVLAVISMPETRALAGDLDHPGIAFPEGFSPHLREQIMTVLTAAPATYVGGRFVNAQTTLRYAGDTAAVNRFLAGLAGCPGMRVQVVFAAEPEAPAWSLLHNAWSDATLLRVRINPQAKGIKLEELILPEIVHKARVTTDSAAIPQPNPAGKAVFGATMERVIPFGVPCARKYFRFRTGEVFAIGDGPADTSDHAEEWAAIDAGGGVDAQCYGSEKRFQLVGRGCVFTRDPAPDWQTTPAGQVIRDLRRAAWITGVVEEESGKLPMTWLFRTFNGDCGILQIAGVSDDGNGLTLRYRLVEQKNPAIAGERHD